MKKIVKQNTLIGILIVIIFIIVLYFAIKDNPKLISYSCENNKKFSLELLNQQKIQLRVGEESPIIFSKETDDNGVLIFSNAKEALTFVSGYGEQIIWTERNATDPVSTICMPARPN